MTTTDLYSGYDRDGKPTSRVLRPPGGGSSNIFGSEPAPQQQLKKQEQKEMLDSNQNQALNNAPQPTSQSQDVQPQPKRKGGSEAPYAENDMENPYGRHGSSQNDQDFRCHSVTAYREAVVRNAEVRDRAHGDRATGVNPITHQEQNGEGLYNQYSQSNQHQVPPQQAHIAASDGYGRKEQVREESALPRHSLMAYQDAVTRNAELRHKYHGGGQATASFNPITHEEFSGEGLPPQHYQHAAPPLPQNNTHACLLDRANYGRRDTHKASSYNPITGEEYPEDYGKKKGEAVKNDEETDKDSDNNNTTSTPTPAPTPTGTTGSNSTPTTTGTNSTPTSAKANIRPSSRVLQPPGGASTGLW